MIERTDPWETRSPPQQVHACPRTDWARLGWGLVRAVRCRTRGKCSHRPDGSCCRLGHDALRGHRLLSRDRSASCASGSPNAATSAAQTWVQGRCRGTAQRSWYLPHCGGGGCVRLRYYSGRDCAREYCSRSQSRMGDRRHNANCRRHHRSNASRGLRHVIAIAGQTRGGRRRKVACTSSARIMLPYNTPILLMAGVITTRRKWCR